jgi:hypothetical protein
VIKSGASLSGVDAVFNRGISAYIINDINRAKFEVIYGLRREKLGFDFAFLDCNGLILERHCYMKHVMCRILQIYLYSYTESCIAYVTIHSEQQPSILYAFPPYTVDDRPVQPGRIRRRMGV